MKKKFIVSENDIVPYLVELSKYINDNGIDIKPFPKVVLSRNSEYKNNPFGKTAYYDPIEKTITLFTIGRHIKDVLRSFAHELIHHNQNISGKLESSHIDSLKNPKYAEQDSHLKKMEEDAYLRGNMIFRQWEDSKK